MDSKWEDNSVKCSLFEVMLSNEAQIVSIGLNPSLFGPIDCRPKQPYFLLPWLPTGQSN
jgi:hypothetical protein